MTEYEIIVLVAGFVFVVASFFLGGRNSPREEVDTDAEIRKIKEAAVLHESEIRDRVDALVTKECNTAVDDVKEKLSKISNDKIMAVDEYASQVLERIETNNQSVVFLYDMLQKKEDEMKSTMNKMEQTRRENRELFDRLEELKQAKARVASRNAAKAAAAKGQATKPAKDKEPELISPTPVARTGISELEHTQAEALTEVFAPKSERENPVQDTAVLPSEELKSEQELVMDRQERVLALYQEQKSIKEISKLLSIGQGEVKLIIDLYAKQNK
jgi:hypothetical protein